MFGISISPLANAIAHILAKISVLNPFLVTPSVRIYQVQVQL